MFRKEKFEYEDAPAPVAIPDTTSAETIIREGTTIEGAVTSSIPLRLDGTVRGEIKSEGSVVIGAKGRLEGNIKARELYISGTIEGDAFVEERTEFAQGGYLRGDLSTVALIIADGAAFDGKCQMRTENAKPAEPSYSYTPAEPAQDDGETVTF